MNNRKQETEIEIEKKDLRKKKGFSKETSAQKFISENSEEKFLKFDKPKLQDASVYYQLITVFENHYNRKSKHNRGLKIAFFVLTFVTIFVLVAFLGAICIDYSSFFV